MGKIRPSSQESGDQEARAADNCLHKMVGRDRLPEWCGVGESKTASKKINPLVAESNQISVSRTDKNNVSRRLIDENQFPFSV